MRNHLTNGPFPLTSGAVESNVTRNRIGHFGLGYLQDDVFHIRYVGRSDVDLSARLKEFAGKYPVFAFCYADSPYQAYARELECYYLLARIQTLDNEEEPVKPSARVA
jgi:hypothetical protein